MSMDRDRVRREYRELSLQTQRLRAARDSDLHPSAIHPLNKNKNRYPDVLPVEETRIRLLPLGEIPASDYINANLVRSDEKFSAICSQAPLPHTFDDFWRMVWEQVRSFFPFSSVLVFPFAHPFPRVLSATSFVFFRNDDPFETFMAQIFTLTSFSFDL